MSSDRSCSHTGWTQMVRLCASRASVFVCTRMTTIMIDEGGVVSSELQQALAVVATWLSWRRGPYYFIYGHKGI